MTNVADLMAWIRDQCDADEARADATLNPPPGYYDKSRHGDALRELATWILNDVDATRRILDLGKDLSVYSEPYTAPPLWERTERLIGERYADRPGYREEWRP